MAKRKIQAPSLARSADPLYREIRAVLESARSSAYRAVNTAMVQAYWQVGWLIVEHEQGGKGRAEYGAAVRDDCRRREFVTHCVTNRLVPATPEFCARNCPGPTTGCSWAWKTPGLATGT